MCIAAVPPASGRRDDRASRRAGRGGGRAGGHEDGESEEYIPGDILYPLPGPDPTGGGHHSPPPTPTTGTVSSEWLVSAVVDYGKQGASQKKKKGFVLYRDV